MTGALPEVPAMKVVQVDQLNLMPVAFKSGARHQCMGHDRIARCERLVMCGWRTKRWGIFACWIHGRRGERAGRFQLAPGLEVSR